MFSLNILIFTISYDKSYVIHCLYDTSYLYKFVVFSVAYKILLTGYLLEHAFSKFPAVALHYSQNLLEFFCFRRSQAPLPSSSRLLKLVPSVNRSRFSSFQSWVTEDTISWEVAFNAAMELHRFLEGEAFRARQQRRETVNLGTVPPPPKARHSGSPSTEAEAGGVGAGLSYTMRSCFKTTTELK